MEDATSPHGELEAYAKAKGKTPTELVHEVLDSILASGKPVAMLQALGRLKPPPEGRYLEGRIGLSKASSAQEAMGCLQLALTRKRITIQEYVALVKATSEAWRVRDSERFAERIERVARAVQTLATKIPRGTLQRELPAEEEVGNSPLNPPNTALRGTPPRHHSPTPFADEWGPQRGPAAKHNEEDSGA